VLAWIPFHVVETEECRLVMLNRMLNRYLGSRALWVAVSCVLHVAVVLVLLFGQRWMLVAYAKPAVLPVELVRLEEPTPVEPPPPPPPVIRPPVAKPIPKRPLEPPKALQLPKPIETPMPKVEDTPPPEPKPVVPEPPPPAVATPPTPPVAPPPVVQDRPAPPTTALAATRGPIEPRQAPTSTSSVINLPPSASDDSNGAPGGRVAAIPPSRQTGTDAGVTQVARPQGGYQVRPSYPASARRQGAQGTTILKVHILTDGRVGDVVVQETAGHPDLDQAAADAVRRWRFEPARRGSDPVAMWVLLPVEFRLR
jgi:protein TonB